MTYIYMRTCYSLLLRPRARMCASEHAQCLGVGYSVSVLNLEVKVGSCTPLDNGLNNRPFAAAAQENGSHLRVH